MGGSSSLASLAAVGTLGVAGGFLLSSGLLKSWSLRKACSARAVAKEWTSKPNPDWQPGLKQPPPFTAGNTISIDCAAESPGVLYPLVISSFVPRPIAFVSTLSKEGVGNLAPYSFFNAMGFDPPILAIGHCWSKGAPKDSLRNILDTEEFVVCIISDWFVESANHTSGPFGPGVDELALTGLTPEPSLKVKPSRVKESAVHLECKLRHKYDVLNSKGQVSTTVVIGEVLMFHIAEAVSDRTPTGKVIVDPVKLRAISRVGGNIFAHTGPFFEIPRPDADGRYPGETDFKPSERDKTIGQSTEG